MSLAKKVAQNTLTQISGKVLSTAIGLFSIAFITRYLGPDGFGKYTTILTFLGFFAVFADFGLTLITVQLISDKNRDEGKTLNALFGLRLISILIFLGIAPLVSFLFPYTRELRIGMLIAMGSFIFPALNQIIIGLLQKKLSMGRDALAENIGRAFLLVGIIISNKLNGGLTGILLATTLASFINFIIHYLLSLKFATIKLTWDFSLWKEIIKKSWPLALTIVLNLIYLRADTLALSIFKSSEEVGLYGASYKIIDVLTTLPFMFAGLILPILTSSWLSGEKNSFKTILQKSFDFMAITAIPIVLGAQFIASDLIVLISGKEFIGSGPILKLLIFSVAAIFLGTMFSHAVIAIDKQKKMIWWYVFTSVSSLVAYILLVPRFSYFGAASVTIYSEALIAIFSAYCIFKYTKFKPQFKVFLKSLLAGGFMSLVLYTLSLYKLIDKTRPLGLIALILIGMISYCVALYIFGGVRKSDIKTVFGKQKKSGGQTFSSIHE